MERPDINDFEDSLLDEVWDAVAGNKNYAKSCGANAQGGGGFQAGNTCASGGGKVGSNSSDRKKMFSGVRGGSLPDSGVVFFTEDTQYAEGYGDVVEVEVDESKLRILDYSHIKAGPDVDYDHETALNDIRDQGVDVSGVNFHDDTEGNGLLKQLVDLGKLEEFDAVKITEWTYGVGVAESLAILDMSNARDQGAVTIKD